MSSVCDLIYLFYPEYSAPVIHFDSHSVCLKCRDGSGSGQSILKILLGVLLGSLCCICSICSFVFRKKLHSVFSKIGSQSDWWRKFPMKFRREQSYPMYQQMNGHNLSSNSNDDILNINDADAPNELDDDYITKLKESSSSFRDEPGQFI
eukprot:TRINITY_DN251_c0_g1_i4.p1 TRINITY_DN251_c0_g1~~TRINITY_DN251_c0_g1_i4.p1  ORF type:complete len:150 (+),score=19.89 TRINITY_DN251_c0_g1_i4:115-564(+)